MEDFLRFLVTPLLSAPNELQIQVNQGSLLLKVAEPDIGRIIGKHGHVINAIRTLLRTYCATHQLPFTNLALDTPPAPKKD